MTGAARPCAPTRRAWLAGAACAALLAPVSAAASGAAARVTLPAAAFVAEALSVLLADGVLARDQAVTRHLGGIDAYRPDGAPLAIADLDPLANEVDRFLAIQLIERVTGRDFAAHLQSELLPRLGIVDARLVGTLPGLAVECRLVDAMRWV